jgi:pimeloyl-ACP methyl ester carboxylesterase
MEVRALIEEKEFKAAAGLWCDHVFAGAFELKGTKRLRELASDYSFWSFLHDNPVQYLEPSALNRLMDIPQPTLIITSDLDLADCKEVADIMEEQIPNSRKVEVQGAGHGMNIDQPEEFNKYVLDFIESLR